jgi:predicted nucleotidyltransferase
MKIEELLKDKREEILQIATKHGAYNVRIFGSVARGEANEDSDIDFLINVRENHSRWFPGGLLEEKLTRIVILIF